MISFGTIVQICFHSFYFFFPVPVHTEQFTPPLPKHVEHLDPLPFPDGLRFLIAASASERFILSRETVRSLRLAMLVETFKKASTVNTTKQITNSFTRKSIEIILQRRIEHVSMYLSSWSWGHNSHTRHIFNSGAISYTFDLD